MATIGVFALVVLFGLVILHFTAQPVAGFFLLARRHLDLVVRVFFFLARLEGFEPPAYGLEE